MLPPSNSPTQHSWLIRLKTNQNPNIKKNKSPDLPGDTLLDQKSPVHAVSVAGRGDKQGLVADLMKKHLIDTIIMTLYSMFGFQSIFTKFKKYMHKNCLC